MAYLVNTRQAKRRKKQPHSQRLSELLLHKTVFFFCMLTTAFPEFQFITVFYSITQLCHFSQPRQAFSCLLHFLC